MCGGSGFAHGAGRYFVDDEITTLGHVDAQKVERKIKLDLANAIIKGFESIVEKSTKEAANGK